MNHRSCTRPLPVRPGWAPPSWAAAQIERFVAILVEALDLRFGPADVDLATGAATVVTAAGEARLGLAHLADRCATLPERRWRIAVYEHVTALGTIEPAALARRLGDLDSVRAHLKARLHPAAHPSFLEVDPVRAPGPPGLVATLVVDLAGAATWVPASAASAWPVPPESLLDEALANTWRDLRCRVEHLRLGERVAVRVTGPSFYTAAVALRPAALLAAPGNPPDAAEDVVVAIPTAHHVLVHPVDGGMPDVLDGLADEAATVHRRGPDRLTPDLLRWSRMTGWHTVPVHGSS